MPQDLNKCLTDLLFQSHCWTWEKNARASRRKHRELGASDRKPSWKQCASNFSWMWDFSSILLALRRLKRVLGAQWLCPWGPECYHVQAAPCLAGGPVFDKFSRPHVPSLCRLLYQLNNACAVMSHTHRRHSTHWDWKDGSSLNKRSFLCNTTATKAFGMNSNSGKCI